MAHGPGCTCLEHPLPASMRVKDARDAYLAENGFSLAEYTEPWTKASFLGVPFVVPNTKRHAWALMLHDLHHVATGYGTDLAGEGEISVFEARRGLRALGAYTAGIVVAGAVNGSLFWPTRMRDAWRVPVGAQNLFTRTDHGYDELLEATVGELREYLGIPRDGLQRGARRLHARAPKLDQNPISAPIPG